MTRAQITDILFKVLSETMSHTCLEKFQSDARLLEDLALDSSLVLQMLMFLELNHGLSISENSLMNKDFETVRSVVQLIYEAQNLPKTEKGLEVYEDLKVHCVVSCLAEIIKRFPKLDHRVLYFSAWDAEVCVNDRFVLSYHDENIRHDFFFEWYEKLYGMKVTSWYDRKVSKNENITKLVSLVENRTADQHIMVMLDMFHLPERVNVFNKDPFPHYVMLGPTKHPELWFMYDPDYRWEGVIAKDRILNAIRQPSVAGGYIFSDRRARAPLPEQIKAYFEAGVVLGRNPVTDAIRTIVTAHIKGVDKNGGDLPLENLGTALKEMPVMSLRKYAYEHGFAYFWRELGLPESEFNELCRVIDELSKTYKLIQYQAMKLSMAKNSKLIARIYTSLDQQDTREFMLKRRLQEVKNIWCNRCFSQCESSNPAGIES